VAHPANRIKSRKIRAFLILITPLLHLIYSTISRIKIDKKRASQAQILTEYIFIIFYNM